MEAITEREVLIKLDSKVSQLSESIAAQGELLTNSIDKLTAMIEKLEYTKLKGHEDRIVAMEKKFNEWGGVWKFAIAVSLIISILLGVKEFVK